MMQQWEDCLRLAELQSQSGCPFAESHGREHIIAPGLHELPASWGLHDQQVAADKSINFVKSADHAREGQVSVLPQ